MLLFCKLICSHFEAMHAFSIHTQSSLNHSHFTVFWWRPELNSIPAGKICIVLLWKKKHTWMVYTVICSVPFLIMLKILFTLLNKLTIVYVFMEVSITIPRSSPSPLDFYVMLHLFLFYWLVSETCEDLFVSLSSQKDSTILNNKMPSKNLVAALCSAHYKMCMIVQTS